MGWCSLGCVFGSYPSPERTRRSMQDILCLRASQRGRERNVEGQTQGSASRCGLPGHNSNFRSGLSLSWWRYWHSRHRRSSLLVRSRSLCSKPHGRCHSIPAMASAAGEARNLVHCRSGWISASNDDDSSRLGQVRCREASLTVVDEQTARGVREKIY